MAKDTGYSHTIRIDTDGSGDGNAAVADLRGLLHGVWLDFAAGADAGTTVTIKEVIGDVEITLAENTGNTDGFVEATPKSPWLLTGDLQITVASAGAAPITDAVTAVFKII
jgi:hypothetical protein